MKKIFLLTFLSLLLSGCTLSNLPNVQIKINKKVYTFEVAATEKDRQKGLMFP